MNSTSAFRSLGLKILSFIVPLILFFMFFASYSFIERQEDVLRTETEKRAYTIIHNYVALTETSILTLNNYLLEAQTQQFSSLQDVLQAAIIDPNGKTLASSEATQKSLINQLPTTALVPNHLGPTHKYQKLQGREILHLAQPVIIEGQTRAVAHLVMSLDSLNYSLANARRQTLGLSFILLGMAILVVGFSSRLLTTPILHLARVAQKISGGDLSAKAHYQSNDELGILANTLNHMASRIKTMLNQERFEKETLQRRIEKLLQFTDQVRGGDLSSRARAERDDNLGQLTKAINLMVEELENKFANERTFRKALEKSKSKLQKANLQLQEVDQLKSDFLNTVSHELRTPLTSIKAFAEILTDTDPEDEASRIEFLGIINKEADRLTRLINNLLDLSRIEAGKMNWYMEEFQLSEIGQDAYNILKPASEKKGINLTAKLEDQLNIYGDKDKIAQVLTNLLGNALKFTPEGGSVHISMERHPTMPDVAEVRVQDSGMGISQEFHHSIFEKFNQVDRSETRNIKGSGLGLPISKNIIDYHHGRIWVESDGTHGSTFFVQLPLNLGEVLEQSQKADSFIICYTNNEQVQEHITSATEPLDNLQLTFIDNIGQGLEQLTEMTKSHKPSLVLLDLHYAGKDFVDVIDRFTTRLSLPTGSIACFSFNPMALPRLQLGHTDLIPKPIDREQLFTTAAQMLDEIEKPNLPIVAIDDDNSVLKVIETVLKPLEQELKLFRNGIKALSWLEDHQAAFVILDISLKEISGLEIFHSIRNSQKSIDCPIILITASSSLPEVRALILGSTHDIGYPMSPEETLSWLKSIEQ